MEREKTKCRPTLATNIALSQFPYYEVVLLFFRRLIWILITQMEWAEARQMVRVKTGTWEVRSSVVYKQSVV